MSAGIVPVIVVLLGSVWHQEVDRTKAEFEVIDIIAAIEPRGPSIFEAPASLHVWSPLFSSNASLLCSTPPDESWTVGFIQQVSNVAQESVYDCGVTFWKFKALPIVDSTKEAVPWYGRSTEMVELPRGANRVHVEVAMYDVLSSEVSWREPRPQEWPLSGADSFLRSYRRKQEFTVWLAAIRSGDNEVRVLREIGWEVDLRVGVSPGKPLGSRARCETTAPTAPIIRVAIGDRIPPECLATPLANESQEMWWKPKVNDRGKPSRLK